MQRIVFLVSGGGGNMRYIFRALEVLALREEVEICAVIADRPCKAVLFARSHHLQTEVITYTRSQPEALNRLLFTIQPDIVVTNIHKILDASTLASCNAQFINLHYSLLPQFAGLISMQTVDAASKTREKVIGVTSHQVNETVDAGAVLLQASFQPQWETDPIERIQDTVFQAGQITILETILRMLQPVDPSTQIQANSIKIHEYLVTWPKLHFVTPEIHATIYKTI